MNEECRFKQSNEIDGPGLVSLRQPETDGKKGELDSDTINSDSAASWTPF
jgi:hypothetical protein